MKTISYRDPRHSDTYVIDLTDAGEFAWGRRYLIGQSRDPIIYERIEDIPEPHRDAIQKMIDDAKKAIRAEKKKDKEQKRRALLDTD